MARFTTLTSPTHSVFDRLGMAADQQAYAAEESSGIATISNGDVHIHCGVGVPKIAISHLVSADFPGKVGVAYNGSDNSMMPVRLDTEHGPIVIAIDAVPAVKGKILSYFFAGDSIEESFRRALSEIEHPEVFAMVAATENAIYGARNSRLMPLCFLKVEEKKPRGFRGLSLASQSNIFGSDGQFEHSVVAGELMIIQKDLRYEWRMINPRADQRACPMEAYFRQKPTAIYAGQEVAATRRLGGIEVGKLWLEKYPELVGRRDVIVMQVPNGGKFPGFGVSDITGFQYESDGIVKGPYLEGSVPIPLQVRYNVIDGIPEGKIILLVEDQVRHGRKYTFLIDQLFRKGAREVHLLSTSFLRRYCPYSNGDDRRDPPIGSLADPEDVPDLLGATSFTCLGDRELRVTLSAEHEFCFECITAPASKQYAFCL